jgi:spore germination protein
MNIHVVQPGETISSIAQIYGVSEYKLIQDNELENPNDLVPGQTIVIAYPEQTYAVQQGDTLESIANAHNVTVMQLLRNNPFLSKRDYIYPGETLVISYDTAGGITTLGFCYPYINEDTLRKTLPCLTYISIFNYRATNEGNIIQSYDDTDIIQTVKEYDTVPLILLSTFTEQGEPDFEIVYTLLLNEDFQDRLINNLLTIMREKGYLGVNLVFSFMNTSNQRLYQNFLEKVYSRLKTEGYLVIVTINPNITSNEEVIFEKIDYSVISNSADAVTFLQFIWGTNFRPPSPVSSIQSLRQFVDYAVTLVPADKFIIGKPIIAYDWVLPYNEQYSAAHALTINSAIRLAQDVGAVIQFDEVSKTPYFEYTLSDIGTPINHIVWMIDARSLSALLELISEYNLNGAGIWNVMIYSAPLWLLINSQYNIVKILHELIS